MKRTVCMIVATMLMAEIIPLAAADDKADSKALQGTWKLLEISSDGKKMDRPKEIEAWATWTIVDNNLSMKYFGEKKANAGTIKLDSTKQPKQINLAGRDEGKEKETVEAIYELDGDTLKIALPQAGPKGKRPATFEDKGVAVLTLKKEKK